MFASLLLAAATAASVPARPTVHALLLNGGDKPTSNYRSHLDHLQEMREVLLARGLSADRITIFSSDGTDPAEDMATRETATTDLWILEGTAVGRRLRPRIELVSTVWPGVELRPATVEGLKAYFADATGKLAPGDTLFLFVTDHGGKNDEDLDDGSIHLWGEELSVRQLRNLLESLAPGVRVVMAMSQCYSGTFAAAALGPPGTIPRGDVCGFFSTHRDRPAYGCYPEGRESHRSGHAFAFIDGLRFAESAAAAHAEVLVFDSTPDVPLSTSDVYLERLIAAEAAARGKAPEALVDELLARAWKDRAAWEPEIRALDRVARAFGSASPRKLADLDSQSELNALSRKMRKYADRWEAALDDLRGENLARFRDAHSEWRDRLDPKALEALVVPAAQALTENLLPTLVAWTRAQPEMWDRLDNLRTLAEAARKTWYRLEVRLAAQLRLRAMLTRIAGRVLLAQDGKKRREERGALERLLACEAWSPGPLPGGTRPRPDSAPMPSFAEELAAVERAVPSWLGIEYRPVPEAAHTELGLPRGAVTVQGVTPGSPAEKAGIARGDVVIGPPGKPFDEPNRIREWTMISPRGPALPLVVARGEERITVNVTLAPFPMEFPRLPGPPPVGARAPELKGLRTIAGQIEPAVRGKQHLLFFWATWCGPCKKALPELMAWSKATGAAVVAISDEDAPVIRAFLGKLKEPFPSLVASDVARQVFAAYGTSGTPTFVLVDEHGTIRFRQVGYGENGIALDGWEWKGGK